MILKYIIFNLCYICYIFIIYLASPKRPKQKTLNLHNKSKIIQTKAYQPIKYNAPVNPVCTDLPWIITTNKNQAKAYTSAGIKNVSNI